MPGGIGAAALKADPLRFQPPPALLDPAAVPAGGDSPAGEQDPMRVRESAARGGAPDNSRATASEGDARDFAVGRPLAPADERGYRRDPIAGYSGSTHTLAAVSRLSVTSRSAPLSRMVLPTLSISSKATRVPGTRFRSCR